MGVINILAEEAEFVVIKEFKKTEEKFLSDAFAVINLGLSCGDISHLENNSLRTINDFKIKINYDELLREAEKYKKIRIWSSRLDIESYLSLLFVLNLFKDKRYDISVIFTDDLIYEESNGKKHRLRNLCCSKIGDLQRLFELEKQISINMFNDYINEWNDAVTVNSPLRIMHKRKLKNINNTFFDDCILKELRNQKQTTKMGLCDIIWERYSEELGSPCVELIMQRIDELIINNIIKVVGQKPIGYIKVGISVEENDFSENKHTVIEMND